ncbi:hypothetical protein P4531_09435, partial [Geobacillus stearothermophilus]|uniref:hypothetical protein n=1 Tax=Geobacillus stearothermophilus TaxID=1422 RepID=UPI002E1A57DE|nr:hypothetical protein [Geobacillus stearothermophilus]
LLYRQHAIHLLVYQYSHHRQGKKKIFSSLYDVAEYIHPNHIFISFSVCLTKPLKKPWHGA